MGSEVSDSERKVIGSDDSECPEVEVRRRKCWKLPITVEPIVFAVFFADSLGDPVTTNFILWRTCENHFRYNKSICNELATSNGNKSNVEALIQPYSAAILTAMNFISVCIPAITALFVGPWSDHNGRKLILVIPALGYLLKYLTLLGFSFFPSLGPEYALVAVIPVALSGGIVNFISAAYSYVSDVTPEEKRFFRISMVEFVLGIGVYLGLLLLSATFKATLVYEYAFTYGVCSLVVAIVTISTYIFLPESVQGTEDQRGILSIFEVKHLKEMFHVCFKKREGNKRLLIFLLIACLTIVLSAGAGNSNVLYLFTRLRFGWNIRDFTFWASITLATYFLGLLFGVMILSKWLKIPEPILGLLSYASQAAWSFYIAFIPPKSSSLMFYTGLVSVFGGFNAPICRAILSKTVSKDDVGKVYALTSSSESFFPLISGPLYTILYNSTIHTHPNAFLMLSGAFYIVCFLFFIVVYIIQRRHSEPDFDSLHSGSDNPPVRLEPRVGFGDKNKRNNGMLSLDSTSGFCDEWTTGKFISCASVRLYGG